MRTWRLCEVKRGLPHTLFHGVNYGRPRRIVFNTWLRADLRMVNDNGTPYISGFHTLPEVDDLKEYAQRFKPTREIAIVPVEIRSWWPKPTNETVLLSEYMYLSREDWTLNRETIVSPPHNSYAVNAAATMFNTLSLPGSASITT